MGERLQARQRARNHFLFLPAQEKRAGVGWKIGLVTVALGIPTILIIGICSLVLGWGVGDW